MKEILFLLKDSMEPQNLQLYDIVNTINDTYHKAIKMKADDVKPSTYINFNTGNDKEDPKFRVGDHV